MKHMDLTLSAQKFSVLVQIFSQKYLITFIPSATAGAIESSPMPHHIIYFVLCLAICAAVPNRRVQCRTGTF